MGQQERTQLDQMINATWMAFESNLNALWSFTDHISRSADDIDHQRIVETANELAELFGEKREDVEEELKQFTPSLEKMELYPDFRENSDVRDAMLAFQDSKFRQRILKWGQENPKKSRRFAEIFFEYLVHPPIDGILLRRSILVSLTSTLEILMTGLLTTYFFHDKTFAPKVTEMDVRLEEAQKEANKIRGFSNHVKTLQGTGIHIDFVSADISTKHLEEIVERRNKIVHTDGRIDKNYKEKAPTDYQPTGAEIGRILLVPDQYLQGAFQEVILFGFLLTQSCWHTWYISNRHNKADRAIKLSIGWHVHKNHHEIALRLIKAAALLDLPDPIQQVFKLEQAAILRESGKESEARAILASFPHSISEKKRLHWKIHLGLEAMRGRTRIAQILLVSAARSNHLTEISPSWIVLQSIKKELWFEKLFENRNKGSLPPKTKARSPNKS